MTENERDQIRREDHGVLAQLMGMVRTVLQSQTDHQRATAERAARQDARIDQLNTEIAQVNRELVRGGKDTAHLKGVVEETRVALDERMDQLSQKLDDVLKAPKSAVTLAATIATVIGTVAVALIQFVLPSYIP